MENRHVVGEMVLETIKHTLIRLVALTKKRLTNWFFFGTVAPTTKEKSKRWVVLAYLHQMETQLPNDISHSCSVTDTEYNRVMRENQV